MCTLEKMCKRKLSNRAEKAAALIYSEESTDTHYISYLSHCCGRADVASQVEDKVRVGEQEHEVAGHFCPQSGSRALNVVFRSSYPFQYLQGLNPWNVTHI